MITAGKAERYIKLILFFACAIPMFFYIDGFISIGGFGFMYHYLYGMGIMLIAFIFFLKDPDVWYTLELLKDGAALALVYVLMVLWSFVIWSIQFEGQETIIKGIFEGIPVVSDLSHAKEYLKQEWVDEILIHVPDSKFPSKLKEQCMLMGIVVHTKIPGSLDMDEGTQFIQRVGSQTVLTSSINSISTTQATVKRTVDIIGGIVGCIFTGILFCIVGPLIYIESPGPIIFSQIRVGYNGKKFKIYKFRSMYPDAEERKEELINENCMDDRHMFKMEFDPRVIGNKILPNGKRKTGIGSFIRKTSIDEFPQFFNVLKGDMSLVGTRPPTVEEVETYDLHHKSRLSTKPGITGLWQISGRSQITDFEKVVELDTDYIKNWSLALDAKILLKTVKVVLCGRGSM